MTRFRDVGAVITTVVVFALLAWCLIYVFKYIGTAAQLDSDGKVVLDEFGNAKTILLAILPLATTAVGYWLGNKGVTEAKEEAKKAGAQKDAVIAAAGAQSERGGPDVLAQAKRSHPEAFGLQR